jgi:hypothetical protein
MSTKLFYSTNAQLAQIITTRFFNGKFRIWAAPQFDNEFNPPSSNPKDIFFRMLEDVKRQDNHSSKMNEIKAGLLKAILRKREDESLTEEQEKEANNIIGASTINLYKPYLYLIPNASTLNIAKAEVGEKAEVLSEEYIIKDLASNEFDIIKS